MRGLEGQPIYEVAEVLEGKAMQTIQFYSRGIFQGRLEVFRPSYIHLLTCSVQLGSQRQCAFNLGQGERGLYLKSH